MTRSALARLHEIVPLKAIFVAMAAEKAELQQLRSETLKAEIVRMATLNERAQERIADLQGSSSWSAPLRSQLREARTCPAGLRLRNPDRARRD
ncbi:hypothetical protein X743_19685 [Mesorhizobium sp. LNHC252B00]|nr:hypothetical protein X743_19685 [Mesorhizobium sp. LNHC252B00]